MSNPIVIEEIGRTEIDWGESDGLLIIQSNFHGEDDDRVWIPASHVPAFVAAIQSVYAKR